MPITVHNEGYIYSSQPICIVFKLFNVLILRETIISTCSGESFFPQSDNNKNMLTKTMCANSFLALPLLNHSPSRKCYTCLKIISLSDKLSSRLNRSIAVLTCSRECSDGQQSFLSRWCLDFMISHCGGDIMINQFR